MKAPSCKHVGQRGPNSVLVSSHKNLSRVKGRMASARVCDRPKCVDEAVAWVRWYMNDSTAVYRNGKVVVSDPRRRIRL